jgi:phosphopantetheine adenylyltransferase|tara:strand:- start:542 stop:955 length:414 start_codon:yes stop_codon:yes gene_type:complete
MVFNDFKPTTQLLGRWQPWHKGHTELFKRALAETGQVIIMVRTVPQKEDASGGRTMVQDDNPFKASDVIANIKKVLELNGYKYGEKYVIRLVPNIVDISYGRGVGYTFTEHDLGEEIHNISATKIRQTMRDTGELEI